MIATMVEESRSKCPDPQDKRHVSVVQAVERIDAMCESNVSVLTACRHVRDGGIDESPSCPGPNKKFPPQIHQAPLGTHQYSIGLTQASGCTQVTQKELGRHLELLLKPSGHCVNGRYHACLFDKELSNDCLVSSTCIVKMRRAEWTSFSNLKLLFDLWASFLGERGFAFPSTEEEQTQTSSELVFLKDHDCQIINIMETDLSLDHTDGKGYGRKPTVCVDKAPPMEKDIKNKSSDRATLVAGSNAAGEALPLHVQFKSNAQANNQL